MRISLWDLPIRVFHWTLVPSVMAAIATAIIGGNWMVWHGRLGLLIIGLVTFRVMWGFFGSHYARFTQFFPTPAKIIAYLNGQWRGEGHNPLGALSVLGLLTILAFQAGTGLFTNDDIAFTAPLFSLVDKEQSNQITQLHTWNAYGIYLLVGLHIAAIAFYRIVKKNDLIRPMITGWKEIDKETQATSTSTATSTRGSWIGFIVSLIVALAAVYGASGAWKPVPPPPPPAAAVETPNF
ncbi:MAG: hypothetical protein RIR79_1236 [Pseudomonadota bacterium]